MSSEKKSNWSVYKGNGEPRDLGDNELPSPPSWRTFQDPMKTRGATFKPEPLDIQMVNAALYLRRPLLITGQPGIGKSSLAYAVAHELNLGSVLEWSITTRSTLQEGLYRYDAIGRLQEAQLRLQEAQLRHLKAGNDSAAPPQTEHPDIGNYIRLGPLGTAFLPSNRPRVLLIDEIDKSDIDLPNDLLHIFEKGEFVIPELERLAQSSVEIMTNDGKRVRIEHGRVRCNEFPFVIFTSNGEREFPPAFLRRCLQITMRLPQGEDERKRKLLSIIERHFEQHFEGQQKKDLEDLVAEFIRRIDRGDVIAIDQLLNAIYLTTQKVDLETEGAIKKVIFKSLSG